MKRIIIVFAILLSVFFIAWGIKLRTPVNRPDNTQDEVEIPWYESRYTSPVADEEWYLDPSIPDNYVPVPGEDELYMVVDDSGNIIGYRQRTMQDDGSWAWEDVNPDIPDNYEPVAGIENLYKVTDAEGNVSYFLYVRNEDDTYTFVESDENGNPYYDGSDAEVIASNYVHEDGNTYAVYDDNGVKQGYAERQKTSDGKFVWKKTDKPAKKNKDNNSNKKTDVAVSTEMPNISTESGNGQYPNVRVISGKGTEEERVTNVDGTYTVTEKSSNTVTKDGYNIMYETTVYNTYDSSGNLISTKTDGPYEVGRTKVAASETPNKELINNTLDGEYSRVTALVSYDTSKANEVLAALNAERVSQGLNQLNMDTGSEAYKLACIRAGDMAQYNYSDSKSPMYGTLDDMVSLWGCQTANSSENIWKTSQNKSASDIHKRLQAYDGSRNVRMSESYTEVGIAIAEKDGQLYIAEIYLK